MSRNVAEDWGMFSSFNRNQREMIERHYPFKFQIPHYFLEEVIIIPFYLESAEELKSLFPKRTSFLKTENATLAIFIGEGDR